MRRDRLDELKDAWSALDSTARNPMQQFIWARACADAFAAEDALRVVALGDRAFAPLVRRCGALERWEMLGTQLHEPQDVAYADDEAADALATLLARVGHPLVFHRVFADAPIIGALRRAFRGRGLVLVRPKAACPVVSLPADLTDAEQLLSSRRRADMRRARRRAEELGPVHTEIRTPMPHEVSEVLDDAFSIEASSWKGRSGTALAADASRAAFFRRYAALAAERGILRVSFLRVGNRGAAMQIAVECGGANWILKIGYDEEFARYSPGMLLILATLQHALARGLHSYELLGTAEPWTVMWTERVRPFVSLSAYPARASGLAALCADMAPVAWRRLRRAARGLGR
jgi:CelD/BcsL family acetyltransferase involved in cellulose biosynthesis